MMQTFHHNRWVSEAGTPAELRMASLSFISTAISHIGVVDTLAEGVSGGVFVMCICVLLIIVRSQEHC